MLKSKFLPLKEVYQMHYDNNVDAWSLCYENQKTLNPFIFPQTLTQRRTQEESDENELQKTRERQDDFAWLVDQVRKP